MSHRYFGIAQEVAAAIEAGATGRRQHRNPSELLKALEAGQHLTPKLWADLQVFRPLSAEAEEFLLEEQRRAVRGVRWKAGDWLPEALGGDVVSIGLEGGKQYPIGQLPVVTFPDCSRCKRPHYGRQCPRPRTPLRWWLLSFPIRAWRWLSSLWRPETPPASRLLMPGDADRAKLIVQSAAAVKIGKDRLFAEDDGSTFGGF